MTSPDAQRTKYIFIRFYKKKNIFQNRILFIVTFDESRIKYIYILRFYKKKSFGTENLIFYWFINVYQCLKKKKDPLFGTSKKYFISFFFNIVTSRKKYRRLGIFIPFFFWTGDNHSSNVWFFFKTVQNTRSCTFSLHISKKKCNQKLKIIIYARYINIIRKNKCKRDPLV